MKGLNVKKLRVSVEGKKILKGVSFHLKPGEVHALMGPNGSGKSTLASTLMGHPAFTVTSGSIHLDGKNIKNLSPDERAHRGLFLSFQYPVEIPGLSIEHFLRTAYASVHPDRKLSPVEFRKLFQKKVSLLRIKKGLTERYLNEGFSGGEKKKLEILQMAVLEPAVAVLDETDSGLDIDALRSVAHGVNSIKKQNPAMSVLLITHYYRILQYIKPDRVHVMQDGRIVKSGTRTLATRIEKKGYDGLLK